VKAASRAGRRIAERAARTRRDRSAMAAAALLVVAALAVGLTRGQQAEGVVGGAAGALVDRVQLSCPTTDLPELAGPGVRTDAFAGLAGGEVGGERPGASGVLGAGLPGDEPTDLDVGRGALAALDTAGDGPVLDGRGDRAVGLFGFRTDRAGSTSAVGACVAPRASWWFTGVGADLDHASELVLTNLDPGPAVVDVNLFGSDGPVDTVGTRGITVAPGESTTVRLVDVAPQSAELMVHVEASRGRVAVAASDRFAARPAAPVGVAWVADAGRPSRVVRLAGVPSRAATKTLLVGNPSGSEALVDVEVAGQGGSFVPSDLETVSVAPGTVETVDLEEVLPDKEAVAVRLRAQVPVLASLRVATVGDVAYAGTAVPLTGPGVVPVLARARTTLHLTAGDTDAAVRVEGFARTGEATGSAVVEVPATATATWRPARGTAYVVVHATQGEVFGAAVFEGAGVATTALRALPIRVRLPAVVPGPR
jgi:hypothetical protein